MSEEWWLFVVAVGVGILAGAISALPYLWAAYMDRRDAKRAASEPCKADIWCRPFDDSEST